MTPGSEQVRTTLARDGQLAALAAVGATVLANACGPCIGQWQRRDGDAPNTIVTSYNRNFPGRNDSQATTQHFIASPEIVIAMALAGRLSFNPLTDPLVGADGELFLLTPPRPAPEVPARGFAPGRSAYVAPPLDGAAVELAVGPASERLQLMEPWPAWDGRDFVDLPLLMKTRGKTTTDHISPAGPWLRYRGHLDKFSDNLLLGATNACTGEVGRVTNARNGATSQVVAAVARDYRAHGLRWVIVGDRNYGEGSSREHAALSPRLLGGAAVIARSFARIHESNLKKQGLLALTFRNPADYDRIREDDRVSLLGLAGLALGSRSSATSSTLTAEASPSRSITRSAARSSHGSAPAPPSIASEAQASNDVDRPFQRRATRGHEVDGAGPTPPANSCRARAVNGRPVTSGRSSAAGRRRRGAPPSGRPRARPC